MTLDIIIPVLNERQNLMELIPYLQDRITTVDTGIIVVDAAKSSDDTEQLCRNANVKYLKSKGSGRSIQMNNGAEASSADIFMFLHADVRPPDIFVHDILSIIYSGIDFGLFSYKFDIEHTLLKINSWTTNKRGFLTGGGDQCHFMTRKLFKELEGYNPNYLIMEDFDLFNRMKKAGYSWEIATNPATVSARKYKNNGYLKVQWINLITVLKFKMNFSQEKLLRTYSNLN